MWTEEVRAHKNGVHIVLYDVMHLFFVPTQLTASPSRSGTYMGSITFTTADNQFVWYSIEVRVKEPPPVGMIEVRALTFDFPANPLHHKHRCLV